VRGSASTVWDPHWGSRILKKLEEKILNAFITK
jgi:hypothetical protein